MQAKQTEWKGRKHLSKRITGTVIRKWCWFKNNLNHFQTFNFLKPQRHLSYILTDVILKCLSCGLVYCQNWSFLDKWVTMNQHLLIQQQNSTRVKSSHYKDIVPFSWVQKSHLDCISSVHLLRQSRMSGMMLFNLKNIL